MVVVEGVVVLSEVVSSLENIKGWMGVIGMGVFRSFLCEKAGRRQRGKRSVFCAAKFRMRRQAPCTRTPGLDTCFLTCSTSSTTSTSTSRKACQSCLEETRQAQEEGSTSVATSNCKRASLSVQQRGGTQDSPGEVSRIRKRWDRTEKEQKRNKEGEQRERR